jgi:tripartite-type tricarboxylate transporter receptor subunit TctC
MKLPRREFLHMAASAVALPAVSQIAWAQAYPSRPVRLIVGFAPGGTADISARIMAQYLSERLGQQFIVENRPGANGNIATGAVVRAPADGYTLLATGLSDVINAVLYEALNFKFVEDIAPVATLIGAPFVIVVHPSFPARTIPELIDYAKASPGRISMASAGAGNPTHLAGELFKTMTGVNLVHVPYRGGGPAITDLLGGQVHTYWAVVPTAIEYIRAGKLRALAVTTAARTEALPDIPTVGEFVKGYEASLWYGVGAPKETPSEITDMLNKNINAALADPKIKARLADLGATALALSQTGYAKLNAAEAEKWGKVVRAANIKPE